MKLKILSVLLFLFALSCKTNKSIEDPLFIDVEKTSDKEILKLFKYTYPINRTFFNIKQLDSFKPVIYSFVRPLDGNKKFPEKIYENFYKDTYAESLNYFKNNLQGKNISYLQKNNEIVFRYYYQDYRYAAAKKSNNFPKNKKDIIYFLEKNKIKYNLLKTIKAGDGDLVNLEIGNKFLQITATSTFCESYTCYELKDSINTEKYGLIVESFFY